MLLKVINEESELNKQIKSSGVNAEYKPISAPTNSAYRILRVSFTTGEDKVEKKPQQKEAKSVKFNCDEQGEENNTLDHMRRSCPASTGKFD